MSPDEIQQFNDNLLRNFPMENLLNYLTILNPEIILATSRPIIRSIEAQLGLRITSNVKVGLYLHISCLIERLIINKTVAPYDKLDELQREHRTSSTSSARASPRWNGFTMCRFRCRKLAIV